MEQTGSGSTRSVLPCTLEGRAEGGADREWVPGSGYTRSVLPCVPAMSSDLCRHLCLHTAPAPNTMAKDPSIGYLENILFQFGLRIWCNSQREMARTEKNPIDVMQTWSRDQFLVITTRIPRGYLST